MNADKKSFGSAAILSSVVTFCGMRSAEPSKCGMRRPHPGPTDGHYSLLSAMRLRLGLRPQSRSDGRKEGWTHCKELAETQS